MEKAFVEDGRDAHVPVMAAQQDPEQVLRLFDEFWRDLEHMTKDELLRSVVAELSRCVLLLRIVQGVEIRPVKRRDDGIAEIREEIAQVERELAASPYILDLRRSPNHCTTPLFALARVPWPVPVCPADSRISAGCA